MPMTLPEALNFIQSASWTVRKPGLERIAALTRRLGNPQDSLRFIHIAGTNGKGSTAAMLSAVLRRAGYRTGFFTSPHLRFYNERIQVDGVPISDRDFCALAEEVQTAAEGLDPSEFDLLTAMGFLYFQRRACGIVLLEAGLGGRLDSTNVIAAPEAAVITGISLEHTEYLGDTLEKIAAEKAGILKPGTSAVLQIQPPAADAVFQARCAALGCERIPAVRAVRRSGGLDGQRLDYRDRRDLFLHLPGVYQCQNAALVLDTVDLLRRKGWNIPEEALRDGLAAAEWPGRFEVLRRTPPLILDGAHNPGGANALAESLEACLPGQKLTFILGVMAGKDRRAMLEAVAPHAARFLTVSPGGPRALDSAILAEELRQMGFAAENAGTLEAALPQASGPACIFGSLYLAGEARSRFSENALSTPGPRQ